MDMCGVAGFHGLGHIRENQRRGLAWALAKGTDRRGGDACGYFAVNEAGALKTGRRVGRWDESFLMAMDAVDHGTQSVALHARYATCGGKSKNNAHPFSIYRGGKFSLVGMHNGIITDAEESAKRHGRRFSVDSREVFELLADGKRDEIERLNGYGTIVWAEADAPAVFRMAKLTESADLEACVLVGGGIVWGSTKRIVLDALEFVGLSERHFYKLDAGIVYCAHDGELYEYKEDRISLSSWTRQTRVPSYGWQEKDDDLWTKYCRSRGFTDKQQLTIGDPTQDEAEALELLEIAALEKEAADLKAQLCSDYGINPEHVADMTLDETYAALDEWGVDAREKAAV